MTSKIVTAIVTVFYKKISSLPMMEAFKKLITLAAAAAILLLLLYIAFTYFWLGW